MQAIRRMGPLSKVFGMLPGAGQLKAVSEIDEKQVDRVEAIIYSMTPAERADVGILNGSRRSRIARGAGVEVRDVNDLVNRFTEARKMMHSMGAMMGGGMPGGAQAGGRKQQTRQQAKKGKGGKRVSGNPAKRAAALSGKPAPQAEAPQGLPTDETELKAAMADFRLPPELQQMLKQQNPGDR